MEKETMGTVVSVSKLWWLKINANPVRRHSLDGAVFPYIVKIQYTVNGITYTKRKWSGAGKRIPNAGDPVKILYNENNPSKSRMV